MKSIDDLMGDTRLLTYAMAAFGLDSTTEPPEPSAAMLEGGVSDPDSPANKLTDKSYANFVSAFNFAQYGDQTTVARRCPAGGSERILAGTGLVLVKPSAQYIKAEADYYTANITKVKSIDDLMADKRLLTFAMAAYGLDAVNRNTDSKSAPCSQAASATPTAPRTS